MGYTAGVEPYSITAEYHDVLWGESHRTRATRLLALCPSAPRYGVLQLAAGSGLATAVVAAAYPVPVYAVETRRPLRALLHTRLLTAGLTARVTVYDAPLADLSLGGASPGGASLGGVADLAICHAFAATLAPEERAETWLALAAALRPGGRVLVELPGLTGGHGVAARQLGGLCYDVAVRTRRLPGERARWQLTYRVSRDDALVRVATETLEGWLPTPEALLHELTAAGLRTERVAGDVASLIAS